MKLSLLLSQLNVAVDPSPKDILLKGIAQDSRQISAGDLFLAYQGTEQDGKDYIAAAVQAGAVVILVDEPVGELVGVPVIVIPRLSDRVSEIASWFYGHPANGLHMIGVTGTNGKTSVACFLKQALAAVAMPVASIGTLGIDFLQSHYTAMTTPSEVVLQHALAELLGQGCEWVAMEVSSHALDQNRVSGISWRYGIFTNLSLDHLDYHGTLFEYQQAKQKLFSSIAEGNVAIVNVDDPVGVSMLESVQAGVVTFGYGASDNLSLQCDKTIRLISHEQCEDYQRVICDSSWGRLSFTTQLLGTHNIYNLLPVIMILANEGVSLPIIGKLLKTIKAPTGRLERFQKNNAPTVWVDFAHTPDALEKVLATLQEACFGRVWVVFGCGGQRDRSKRPLMAHVVEKYADVIILTQDNSRQEPVAQIFADVEQGFSAKANYTVVEERQAAINHALDKAGARDWILLAGRGHEPILELADAKHLFCDVDYIKTRYQCRETSAHAENE